MSLRAPTSQQAPSRVTAHSTALVPQDCTLVGEITIGQGVIIHPKASILASNGPIIIGDDCIVEEMAVIVNSTKEMLRIGKRNHFMVGCRIEAISIGDDNTFHPRCAVSGVKVSNECTIAAGTIVLPSPATAGSKAEVLLDRTVVFGDTAEHRIWDGSGHAAEKAVADGQRQYLRETLPKFNRMRVV